MDGRFEGSFQKAEMLKGVNYIKLWLSKQKKVEKKKIQILFPVCANNTFPEMHKVLKVNWLLLSESKCKNTTKTSENIIDGASMQQDC